MSASEDVHILVIFSCETGAVEQLALAAAVGAVQARASIRLRRMVDPAGAHNVHTERMDQDYVAPREADIAWADGLVLAVHESFFPQIEALGNLSGRPVGSLTKGDLEIRGELREMNVLSDRNNGPVDRDGARLVGRGVAETVRVRRGSSQ